MSLVVEASGALYPTLSAASLELSRRNLSVLVRVTIDRFDSIPAQPCSLEPASPAVPTTSKNKKNQDDNDQKRRVVHFVLLR
jgi:hypothetical protein